MPDSANVYQAGRFDGDEDYWKNGLELKDWVKVQKKRGLRFYLRSSQDFVYFSKTVERDPSTFAWTRGSFKPRKTI